MCFKYVPPAPGLKPAFSLQQTQRCDHQSHSIQPIKVPHQCCCNPLVTHKSHPLSPICMLLPKQSNGQPTGFIAHVSANTCQQYGRPHPNKRVLLTTDHRQPQSPPQCSSRTTAQANASEAFTVNSDCCVLSLKGWHPCSGNQGVICPAAPHPPPLPHED